MKFFAIAPVRYTNLVKHLNDHLVVSSVLSDHPETIEFYKHLPEDAYIILDNGAWEHNLSFTDELLDLAKEINTDEIIMPDSLGNGEETYKLIQEFRGILTNWEIRKYTLNGVIQGNDVKECINCYLDIKNVCDVVSLPKHLEDERLELLDMINFDEAVHFLGINGVDDLQYLAAHKEKIRSFDTAWPFKCAKANQDIFITMRLPKFDFEMTGDEQFVKQAKENIAKLIKYVR